VRKGLAYVALANGFATRWDPTRLRSICDQRGPVDVGAFVRPGLRSSRSRGPTRIPGWILVEVIDSSRRCLAQPCVRRSAARTIRSSFRVEIRLFAFSRG